MVQPRTRLPLCKSLRESPALQVPSHRFQALQDALNARLSLRVRLDDFAQKKFREGGDTLQIMMFGFSGVNGQETHIRS